MAQSPPQGGVTWKSCLWEPKPTTASAQPLGRPLTWRLGVGLRQHPRRGGWGWRLSIKMCLLGSGNKQGAPPRPKRPAPVESSVSVKSHRRRLGAAGDYPPSFTDTLETRLTALSGSWPCGLSSGLAKDLAGGVHEASRLA